MGQWQCWWLLDSCDIAALVVVVVPSYCTWCLCRGQQRWFAVEVGQWGEGWYEHDRDLVEQWLFVQNTGGTFRAWLLVIHTPHLCSPFLIAYLSLRNRARG